MALLGGIRTGVMSRKIFAMFVTVAVVISVVSVTGHVMMKFDKEENVVRSSFVAMKIASGSG